MESSEDVWPYVCWDCGHVVRRARVCRRVGCGGSIKLHLTSTEPHVQVWRRNYRARRVVRDAARKRADYLGSLCGRLTKALKSTPTAKLDHTSERALRGLCTALGVDLSSLLRVGEVYPTSTSSGTNEWYEAEACRGRVAEERAARVEDAERRNALAKLFG